MTTEKDVAVLFDEILANYFEEIASVAHDGNSQEKSEHQELLNEGIKKQTDICLSILVKLYSEYIKPENAHVQNALEFIPIFGVFGLWIGAQLGVSQNEYYKIVDYYLERFNLIEK